MPRFYFTRPTSRRAVVLLRLLRLNWNRLLIVRKRDLSTGHKQRIGNQRVSYLLLVRCASRGAVIGHHSPQVWRVALNQGKPRFAQVRFWKLIWH